MEKVKTHTFNKRKYNILVWPTRGLTDVSKHSPLTLVVSTKQSDRQFLITAIHEALHASGWDKSEKKVDRVAEDTGKFLWRLGYRTDYGKKIKAGNNK